MKRKRRQYQLQRSSTTLKETITTTKIVQSHIEATITSVDSLTTRTNQRQSSEIAVMSAPLERRVNIPPKTSQQAEHLRQHDKLQMVMAAVTISTRIKIYPPGQFLYCLLPRQKVSKMTI